MRLDLLFVKENNHKPNMNFDTFLNILPKIASYKYNDSDIIDPFI